jgi:hypothetical protein
MCHQKCVSAVIPKTIDSRSGRDNQLHYLPDGNLGLRIDHVQLNIFAEQLHTGCVSTGTLCGRKEGSVYGAGELMGILFFSISQQSKTSCLALNLQQKRRRCA